LYVIVNDISVYFILYFTDPSILGYTAYYFIVIIIVYILRIIVIFRDYNMAYYNRKDILFLFFTDQNKASTASCKAINYNIIIIMSNFMEQTLNIIP